MKRIWPIIAVAVVEPDSPTFWQPANTRTVRPTHSQLSQIITGAVLTSRTLFHQNRTGRNLKHVRPLRLLIIPAAAEIGILR